MLEPVAALRETPEGRAPVLIDQLYGAVPPAVEQVAV
jgi:hypothetical protein